MGIISFLKKFIDKLTVTSKPSKNRIVLAGITVLYLVNIMGGYLQWTSITHVIETNGKPENESMQVDDLLIDINQDLPLIVADGLLVRGP